MVTYHRCSLYFKITMLLQVPSVLREDLPVREVPWGKQTKALLGGSTTLELSDAVSVSLTFRPLGVTVLVHGQPAVTFNSRQMFAMEHSVEKKVRRSEPATHSSQLLRSCNTGCGCIQQGYRCHLTADHEVPCSSPDSES